MVKKNVHIWKTDYSTSQNWSSKSISVVERETENERFLNNSVYTLMKPSKQSEFQQKTSRIIPFKEV